MVHSNVQSQVLTLICNEPLSSWQKQFREYQNCFQANILNVISSETAFLALRKRPRRVQQMLCPAQALYLIGMFYRAASEMTGRLHRCRAIEMFW